MLTPSSVIENKLRGSSYRKLAASLGVSAGHLHKVHKGVKEAGDELLAALELERVTRVTYRRRA